MFILRTVSNEGAQANLVLGQGYNFIGRVENPEQFRELYKEYFGTLHVADLDPKSTEQSKNTYGFIIGWEKPDEKWKECNTYHLEKDQKVYIMTESGKTFSNLTCK